MTTGSVTSDWRIGRPAKQRIYGNYHFIRVLRSVIGDKGSMLIVEHSQLLLLQTFKCPQLTTC